MTSTYNCVGEFKISTEKELLKIDHKSVSKRIFLSIENWMLIDNYLKFVFKSESKNELEDGIRNVIFTETGMKLL